MILLSKNILLLRIVKLQFYQLGLDIPKPHKMKSQGFRSGDLAGHTTRPFRLIQHAGKFSVVIRCTIMSMPHVCIKFYLQEHVV
jgi:hypothetical protein